LKNGSDDRVPKGFAIRADGAVIVHSFLEHGDPPMGVAFGLFIPAPSFPGFEDASKPASVDNLGPVFSSESLSAETDAEVEIDCAAVTIVAFKADNAVEFEVTLLGIPNLTYEKLFPGRYAAYEENY
jgi:hypothetical protein